MRHSKNSIAVKPVFIGMGNLILFKIKDFAVFSKKYTLELENFIHSIHINLRRLIKLIIPWFFKINWVTLFYFYIKHFQFLKLRQFLYVKNWFLMISWQNEATSKINQAAC